MFRLVRNARMKDINQNFQFTHDFQMVPITPIFRIIVFYLDTETPENIYFMKITVRVLDSESGLYLLYMVCFFDEILRELKTMSLRYLLTQSFIMKLKIPRWLSLSFIYNLLLDGED